MPSVVAFDLRASRITKDVTDAIALYVDMRDDTLYAAFDVDMSNGEVVPLFDTAPQVATWRSKRVVLDRQPGFSWLRLEGPFTSAVVRLYGDGELVYTTPAITNNNPVRLPAGRYREFEVELESDDRITDVTLATSSVELASS